MGTIHSTKISGNFGPKLNGSVRSNRKSFKKTGPPFEVVLFSRSDRSEFWLNGSRPVSYQNSSKRQRPFWLLIGARKLLCFSAQSEARTAATVWNWSGKTMGAIHSTKISGNFGPKLNGSVRSNRKRFEKTGPPFEVDHFSRSDPLEFWLNGRLDIPAKTNSSEDVDISASDSIVLFFE